MSVLASSSSSKNLMAEFQNSFTFGSFFEECVGTFKTLRGNCWTHEVLINNSNVLLEKFLKSNYEALDEFFRHYVESQYSKMETANNFVLVFFLSLEHFAPLCFEAEALKYLFQHPWTRPIIEDWWRIRDTILFIYNMSGQVNVPLNNFFLTKSESLVLIERIRNSLQVKKEISQWIADQELLIKELRKEVRHGKKNCKPRLAKYEKNFKIGSGKTCSSPVALKLLGYFVQDYKNAREKKYQTVSIEHQDDGEAIDKDDIVLVDDNLNILQKSKIQEPIDGAKTPAELAMQKKALAEEIQRLTRESNMRREGVLKLVGLLKALDPVFLETKEKIEIVRRKLGNMKRNIKDDDANRLLFMEIGLEGNNLFDKGSKTITNTNPSILGHLKVKDVDFSRDVGHRSQGYATHMTRYIQSLREKILADKDLFRRARLGKNQKLLLDFAEMNKGIQGDKLNQAEYPTRKIDGDFRDNEVCLDNEVLEVYDELEGAKERYRIMLKELRRQQGAANTQPDSCSFLDPKRKTSDLGSKTPRTPGMGDAGKKSGFGSNKDQARKAGTSNTESPGGKKSGGEVPDGAFGGPPPPDGAFGGATPDEAGGDFGGAPPPPDGAFGGAPPDEAGGDFGGAPPPGNETGGPSNNLESFGGGTANDIASPNTNTQTPYNDQTFAKDSKDDDSPDGAPAFKQLDSLDGGKNNANDSLMQPKGAFADSVDQDQGNQRNQANPAVGGAVNDTFGVPPLDHSKARKRPDPFDRLSGRLGNSRGSPYGGYESSRDNQGSYNPNSSRDPYLPQNLTFNRQSSREARDLRDPRDVPYDSQPSGPQMGSASKYKARDATDFDDIAARDYDRGPRRGANRQPTDNKNVGGYYCGNPRDRANFSRANQDDDDEPGRDRDGKKDGRGSGGINDRDNRGGSYGADRPRKDGSGAVDGSQRNSNGDRDPRSGRDSRDGYDDRDPRGGYDGRDPRGGYDDRDLRGGRDPRGGYDDRDPIGGRDSRDGYDDKDPRDGGDPRGSYDDRDPRGGSDNRNPRGGRGSDERDPRNQNDERYGRDPRGADRICPPNSKLVDNTGSKAFDDHSDPNRNTNQEADPNSTRGPSISPSQNLPAGGGGGKRLGPGGSDQPAISPQPEEDIVIADGDIVISEPNDPKIDLLPVDFDADGKENSQAQQNISSPGGLAPPVQRAGTSNTLNASQLTPSVDSDPSKNTSVLPQNSPRKTLEGGQAFDGKPSEPGLDPSLAAAGGSDPRKSTGTGNADDGKKAIQGTDPNAQDPTAGAGDQSNIPPPPSLLPTSDPKTALSRQPSGHINDLKGSGSGSKKGTPKARKSRLSIFDPNSSVKPPGGFDDDNKPATEGAPDPSKAGVAGGIDPSKTSGTGDDASKKPSGQGIDPFKTSGEAEDPSKQTSAGAPPPGVPPPPPSAPGLPDTSAAPAQGTDGEKKTGEEPKAAGDAASGDPGAQTKPETTDDPKAANSGANAGDSAPKFGVMPPDNPSGEINPSAAGASSKFDPRKSTSGPSDSEKPTISGGFDPTLGTPTPDDAPKPEKKAEDIPAPPPPPPEKKVELEEPKPDTPTSGKGKRLSRQKSKIDPDKPKTPPDAEKLTTLEDLLNASSSFEFQGKLNKYQQGK